MNREPQPAVELIDLGTASTETKGGLIAVPADEKGFYNQAGISDD
jgi:hypothetical protein